MPEMLYSEVVSINERVILKGDSQIEEERSLREATAANGEQLLILKELDISEVRSKLNKVYSNGIRFFGNRVYAFVYVSDFSCFYAFPYFFMHEKETCSG